MHQQSSVDASTSKYNGKVTGRSRPVSAGVTQNWGPSRIHYQAGRHTGMDFGAKSGSTVRAAAAGVVTRVGKEGAYGNSIHVKHADGTTSVYAHLSGFAVAKGQRVGSGQYIGKSGKSGRAFGAHLHFEVRKTDRYGGDVNPRSWMSIR
jgi:murein DD-endopeptidase MepM/ murein hydrolase activator NlpD